MDSKAIETAVWFPSETTQYPMKRRNSEAAIALSSKPDALAHNMWKMYESMYQAAVKERDALKLKLQQVNTALEHNEMSVAALTMENESLCDDIRLLQDQLYDQNELFDQIDQLTYDNEALYGENQELIAELAARDAASIPRKPFLSPRDDACASTAAPSVRPSHQNSAVTSVSCADMHLPRSPALSAPSLIPDSHDGVESVCAKYLINSPSASAVPPPRLGHTSASRAVPTTTAAPSSPPHLNPQAVPIKVTPPLCPPPSSGSSTAVDKKKGALGPMSPIQKKSLGSSSMMPLHSSAASEHKGSVMVFSPPRRMGEGSASSRLLSTPRKPSGGVAWVPEDFVKPSPTVSSRR